MKKNLNMKRLLMTCCLVIMTVAASAQNEKMNNETVLSLLKEGFTSEEIIGAIENSTDREITYSIDFMRQLKAAGAEPSLTTYIQKIARTDFGYEGVMWWNPSNGGKPKKLYRTQFEQESKGFNLGTLGLMAAGAVIAGSAVSGKSPSSGVAAATAAGTIALISTGKDIQKLMLPGASAKTQLEGANARNPVFRFFFPKNDNNSFEKSANNWYQMIMSAIESPNEFQCIKMQVKEPKKNGKGGRRLFPDKMSYSAMGFEGSNASGRTIINFEINEINNSTFEVTFPGGLEPGEYCFFYKGALSNDTFKEHPFAFDFSVK